MVVWIDCVCIHWKKAGISGNCLGRAASATKCFSFSMYANVLTGHLKRTWVDGWAGSYSCSFCFISVHQDLLGFFNLFFWHIQYNLWGKIVFRQQLLKITAQRGPIISASGAAVSLLERFDKSGNALTTCFGKLQSSQDFQPHVHRHLTWTCVCYQGWLYSRPRKAPILGLSSQSPHRVPTNKNLFCTIKAFCNPPSPHLLLLMASIEEPCKLFLHWSHKL